MFSIKEWLFGVVLVMYLFGVMFFLVGCGTSVVMVKNGSVEPSECEKKIEDKLTIDKPVTASKNPR